MKVSSLSDNHQQQHTSFPSFVGQLTICWYATVGGKVNLDEMRVLPGEGNGGPRDITRESQNWRAAVFGRLGTTMDTATRIDQHTRDQLAYLKKQMKHLRAEVKLYMFVRRVPTETTVTRRGTVVEAGVAPTTKPATNIHLFVVVVVYMD